MSLDADDASSIADARPGNYVLWSITDTGTGIAPDIRERIFEPFFSTKKSCKGAGLGLSTLMGIVKSHGGFVQVFSTPNEGSTFGVYLPIDTSEATATEESPPTPFILPTVHGDGETVLVVERDAGRRQVARTLLTPLGFKVLTANDVSDAIVQIIQTGDQRSSLRTVITDLHMPHMNGVAFLQVIKRMLPFAEVITSSQPADEAELEAFRTLGINLLPGTQSHDDELVHTLQEVLEKRRGQTSVPDELFEQGHRTAAFASPFAIPEHLQKRRLAGGVTGSETLMEPCTHD